MAISENTKSKYQPYSEYKESGMEWLRRVPTHWDINRLKWSVRLRNEKVENGELDTPYLGLENVESWTGRIIESDFRPEVEGASNSFQKNDVLFGKLRPYLAKVVHAQRHGICTSELMVLRPQKYWPRYLFYYMLSRSTVDIIDSSTYGVKMPRANWDFIGNLPFLLPPLPEQQAIADFLDRETTRIDELIARKKRLIELLQEKRIALITRTVTKGLNPDAPMKDSGIEWLGKIPKGWNVRKLKYVGQAIIGLTFQPSDVVDESQGILVLRASNIQNGRVSMQDNVYVKTLIPSNLVTCTGDILICSRSGSRDLIGKSAKITPDAAGVTFGAFMTVFRGKMCDYLYYVFNSQLFNCELGAFQTTTINQLTINILNNFRVPLPPIEEQQAIANFLDSENARIEGLISKINQAIEKLQEYRSALITAAVTGKIDVRAKETAYD